MNCDLDKYFEIYKYLTKESVLEIFESKREFISFDKDKLLKIKKGSNFRRKEYGLWIDYHLDSNDLLDIKRWLLSLDVKENNQIRIDKKFISKNESWNYNEVFEEVSDIFNGIAKEYMDIKLISKKAAYNEFSKIIISGKGALEYRIIKYITCTFIFKYKDLKQELKLSISREDSSVKLEEEIREKIQKIVFINEIPKLNKEELISILGKEGINCISKPEFSGGLIHETVGHNGEGDIFCGEELIGNKICSSNITVIDYAKGLDVPNSYYIDGEGNLTYDVKLIDKGILSEVLSSEEGSIKPYEKIAGGVRSFEDEDFPLIRMRNTALLPGKDEVESIIDTLENGLILEEYNDGSHFIDGKFFVECKNAYVVKNKKIIGYLERLKLSSDVYSFLRSIIKVGVDFRWTKNLWCNKEGFKVPIACGAPTIKCELNLCNY